MGEGDGAVEVCAVLSSLPPGGDLECDITVLFGVTDGPIARKCSQ